MSIILRWVLSYSCNLLYIATDSQSQPVCIPDILEIVIGEFNGIILKSISEPVINVLYFCTLPVVLNNVFHHVEVCGITLSWRLTRMVSTRVYYLVRRDSISVFSSSPTLDSRSIDVVYAVLFRSSLL